MSVSARPTTANRQRLRIALVLAAISLGVGALWLNYSRGFPDADGANIRVLVVPFTIAGTPPGWSGDSLAAALAERLAAVSKVQSMVSSGREAGADYVIEGDVWGEEFRFTVAVRVRRAGSRAALWSATFWRENLTDSTLATDLASAVVDAVNFPRNAVGPRTDSMTSSRIPQ